jgi:RNA polymerase sigma factor (sigma-70 family)
MVTEKEMKETPLINATLQTRIKDEPHAGAWREFVRFYGPVVYRFARKRGLRDADAAALMQEVLRTAARNAIVPEYAPERGILRGRLFTVARNKIGDFLSAQKDHPRETGAGEADTSEFQAYSIPGRASEPDPDWNAEYQRQLALKAMDSVKHEFHSSTWQAFWRASVDGRPARDVGLELKMTPGAVHVAKSQVLARLNKEVQRLRSEVETW